MITFALVVAFTVAAWAAYWTGRLDGEESAQRQSRRRHPSDRPLTGQAAVDAYLAEHRSTGIWCLACPDHPRVVDPTAHSRLFHGSRTTGPDDDDEWLAVLR